MKDGSLAYDGATYRIPPARIARHSGARDPNRRWRRI
jgi:hypothetical protein